MLSRTASLNSTLYKLTVLLLSILLLTACGSISHKTNTVKPLKRSDDYRHTLKSEHFKPIDLSKKISEKHVRQKTKRLILLVDESQSMFKAYKGKTKKQYLKHTLQNFQNSIPTTVFFTQEIMMFGNTNKPNIHTLATLPSALRKIVKKLNGDMEKSAVLILSEWRHLKGNSRKKLQQVQNEYPQLCIHMIGIGNIHNNYQFFGHCGQAITANQLKRPEKMAKFVEQLFYAGPADSDEDGIYDFKDKCPNTQVGIPINWDGCPRNSLRSNPRYLIVEPI